MKNDEEIFNFCETNLAIENGKHKMIWRKCGTFEKLNKRQSNQRNM